MTKFTSDTIALYVIASLASASTLAAEPLPAVNEELKNTYVQNDVPAPVTLMPREGVPDEDVYQYRAAAPQEFGNS